MAKSLLPYRVECRDVGLPYFEAIAAFDVDVAAFSYARNCSRGALAGAAYRVTCRGKVLRDFPPLPAKAVVG